MSICAEGEDEDWLGEGGSDENDEVAVEGKHY